MVSKVSVDEEKCIGCSACVATCPEGFKMEGGKAQVIGVADCSEAAADGCPVDAISVE